MADTPFTSVALVKSYLSVQPQTVTDVGLLQQLVDAVSKAFRTRLNRDILSANYDEVLDGTGTNRIVLGNYPVTAVSLVEVGPPSGRTPLVLNQDYVWNKFGLQRLFGVFCADVAGVHVTYTAGFATIPSDLEDAATKTVAFRYKQLMRLGQNSKSQGQETVTFDTSAFTKDVAGLLDNYKKVFPG